MSMTWATILCFLLLPLLFGLLVLGVEARGRIPRMVWRAFFEVFDPEHPDRMELCRDRWGWFVRERFRSVVVWSDTPLVLRFRDDEGRWVIRDRTTGTVLFRGRWRPTWVRSPHPRQRTSLFSLSE